MFVCAYIHMYVQVPVRPEDSNGPLRLKLQDVVSCPTEMPKTEVKSRYREHTSQIVQWELRERESYTILWTKLTMIGLARKGVIYLFSQTIKLLYKYSRVLRGKSVEYCPSLTYMGIKA